MYPAKYASIERVHTVEEALLYPTDKAKGADLFLFVLDTYDVLLSCVGGDIPCSPEACEKLRDRLYELLVTRYEDVKHRIPGRLKGWTEAMFIFVAAALAGTMGTSSSLVPPKVREWMRDERLRVNDSYDVMEWSYTDLISAIEALESRWKTKTSWGPHCPVYLRCLEHGVDVLVSRTSAANVMNYTSDRAGNDPYQMTPPALQAIMSRIVNMRRSMYIRNMWKPRPTVVPESQWKEFFNREKRHLTTRKFRNQVGETVWKLLLRPSEQDRAAYTRKAAVSAFGSLSKERSLDVMDSIGDLVKYRSAEEIFMDERTRDALAMRMVHAYFMSTYGSPFIDYFVCMEEKIWKHMKALRTAPSPFIVERSGRFDTAFKGILHENPDGSFASAFIVWCQLVRVECGSILYGGMNLKMTTALVLDPPKAIERRVVKGTVSYL